MTIEHYNLISTGDIHTIEYAIFDGPAIADVKQQISNGTLINYLKETGLTVCPVNYLMDNLWSVICEFVNVNIL